MSKSSRRRSRQQQARRSRYYSAPVRRDPITRATSRHDYFGQDFIVRTRPRVRIAQRWDYVPPPVRPAMPRQPRLTSQGYATTLPVQRTTRQALICARRKIRREVLFSKGRTGSGNRSPRFGRDSKVEC